MNFRRFLMLLVVSVIVLSSCTNNTSVSIPLIEVINKNEYGTDQACRYCGYMTAFQDGYSYHPDYTTGRSLYRTNIGTGATYRISKSNDKFGHTQVIGEYTYSFTYDDFYGAQKKGLEKVNINGSDEKTILFDYRIKDFVTTENKLYFTTGSSIFSYDYGDESVVNLISAETDHIAVVCDDIYYSVARGYKSTDIYCYSVNTSDVNKCVTGLNAVCWIVDGENIYYQEYDCDEESQLTPSLRRIKINGEDDTELYHYSDFVTSSFNISGDKIFILDTRINDGSLSKVSYFVVIVNKYSRKILREISVDDIGSILTNNKNVFYEKYGPSGTLLIELA